MTASLETQVSLLNHLIEVCKDGEKGYRQASEETKHPFYTSVFGECARKRRNYAVQLQGVVRSLHAEPDQTGSFAGAFHRSWMNVKTHVGRTDDAVIAECERGDESAVKNYEHALAVELPQDLREILEHQCDDIRHTLRRMKAMRRS